jgi:hypothetical protein
MKSSGRMNRALLSVVLLLVSVAISRAEEPSWLAGAAAARITPDEPLWMAGYAARDRPSEGTLHDLWVKVLALEDADGRRAVVVTSDLLGFPKDMSESICGKLDAECGLPRQAIMLTASHSHSSPVLAGTLVDCYPLDDVQRQRIDKYSAALENTVVETIKMALGRLGPATLRGGDGHTNFAVNRRTYRGLDVPPLEERQADLAGPSDHRVPVLAVRTPDGSLLAATFGYACHNTTLSDYQWCGDYAGFAQLDLEEKHPGALAMFYSGCGADQNPLPRRDVELCRQYGRLLFAAVDEVLAGKMRRLEPRLTTAFQSVELEFQPLPTREELDVLARGKDYRGRWARRMLDKTDAGRPLPRSYPYPVQVWKLGSDQLWIALGGEVVVDYALGFKNKYGANVWVAGYANDVMAYIPSQRVWEEGGYEAGAFEVYGLPAAGWASGIELQINECVKRLVRQVDHEAEALADRARK